MYLWLVGSSIKIHNVSSKQTLIFQSESTSKEKYEEKYCFIDFVLIKIQNIQIIIQSSLIDGSKTKLFYNINLISKNIVPNHKLFMF